MDISLYQIPVISSTGAVIATSIRGSELSVYSGAATVSSIDNAGKIASSTLALSMPRMAFTIDATGGLCYNYLHNISGSGTTIF